MTRKYTVLLPNGKQELKEESTYNAESKFVCENRAFTLRKVAFKFNQESHMCTTWSDMGVDNATSVKNEAGIMRRGISKQCTYLLFLHQALCNVIFFS